ncbi:MAG: hypothetical protein KBC06_01155 [Candidatus Pacebacteria bacterium]|nr:hypothetical protein [Candidatus Paceibacterota bacterium]
MSANAFNFLIIPAQSGRVDFRGFFPWAEICNISHTFEMFMKDLGHNYQAPEFVAKMFHSEGDETAGFWCKFTLAFNSPFEPNKICAILNYLGSEDGSRVLDVPEGQTEINIILGYTMEDGGGAYVLYLTLKLRTNNVKEIHLDAKSLSGEGKLWSIHRPHVCLYPFD